jgi:hypothetical protein
VAKGWASGFRVSIFVFITTCRPALGLTQPLSDHSRWLLPPTPHLPGVKLPLVKLTHDLRLLQRYLMRGTLPSRPLYTFMSHPLKTSVLPTFHTEVGLCVCVCVCVCVCTDGRTDRQTDRQAHDSTLTQYSNFSCV